MTSDEYLGYLQPGFIPHLGPVRIDPTGLPREALGPAGSIELQRNYPPDWSHLGPDTSTLTVLHADPDVLIDVDLILDAMDNTEDAELYIDQSTVQPGKALTGAMLHIKATNRHLIYRIGDAIQTVTGRWVTRAVWPD